MTGNTKQQVREFYNQVGWQQVSQGVYQNARYEDLRPVAREYIQRCHLRLGRFLSRNGVYLLDAGSGPVQYPEYMTYSDGYRYRVCADISILALKEARQRVGERGLYVVADVANLPFQPAIFDGVVSLHAIHHISYEEQIRAYQEIHRVLAPGKNAVIVNSWKSPRLTQRLFWLVRLAERFQGLAVRIRNFFVHKPAVPEAVSLPGKTTTPTGTYTQHDDAALLKLKLEKHHIPAEIRVWRSVGVRFTRALIHSWLGGRLWLKLVYGLEELFPHYFGVNGQYPLILIRKFE